MAILALWSKPVVQHIILLIVLDTIGANNIVVLFVGRLVEQGATDQILSPLRYHYTQLPISSDPEMQIGWPEDILKTCEAAAAIFGEIDIKSIGCSLFNKCPKLGKGTRNVQPLQSSRLTATTWNATAGYDHDKINPVCRASNNSGTSIPSEP